MPFSSGNFFLKYLFDNLFLFFLELLLSVYWLSWTCPFLFEGMFLLFKLVFGKFPQLDLLALLMELFWLSFLVSKGFLLFFNIFRKTNLLFLFILPYHLFFLNGYYYSFKK